MPVPAPLSDEPEEPSGHSYTRQYRDPLQRPYRGRVTAKRLDPPAHSVEAELVDGVLRLDLAPGRYSLTAVLRDEDGVRAFQMDDFTQEGS